MRQLPQSFLSTSSGGCPLPFILYPFTYSCAGSRDLMAGVLVVIFFCEGRTTLQGVGAARFLRTLDSRASMLSWMTHFVYMGEKQAPLLLSHCYLEFLLLFCYFPLLSNYSMKVSDLPFIPGMFYFGPMIQYVGQFILNLIFHIYKMRIIRLNIPGREESKYKDPEMRVSMCSLKSWKQVSMAAVQP